ncbi:MAG: glutathione S-transferase family protein [Woeseiaceae bacterium]|nr:glutathione S-transferase family protein [Woeseiaceae bacterium]
MLELYHYEPGANSLKPLLCLKEKKLEFTSRYIDLHEFEQHDPEFVKVNPNGQVPALVHDGAIVTESTVINEYLEDVFPDVPLRPEDPVARANMRVWTKFVDEYFNPAASVLGWDRIIESVVAHLSEEEFEEKLKRIPLKEQQDKWRAAATHSFPQEQLQDCRRRIKVSVEKIEKALESNQWVAGEKYSLADISVFSVMAPMPMFYSDTVNQEESPRCLDWHARMLKRPAVRDMYAMAKKPVPFLSRVA